MFFLFQLYSPLSHPYSLHYHPDSPHYHRCSPHYHSDLLDSHPIPNIPHIPTQIFRIFTPVPRISTQIPRIPTPFSAFLSFRSPVLHSGFYREPTKYVQGLIDTLLYRVYNICTSYSCVLQEIKYLKTVWQNISFPLFFINKCVQKFLKKLFIKHNHQNLTSTKEEVLVTFYSI